MALKTDEEYHRSVDKQLRYQQRKQKRRELLERQEAKRRAKAEAGEGRGGRPGGWA